MTAKQIMKRRLSIGGSDFESFIERDAILVDKTLLVQDVLDDGGDVVLITRPRRWGKTLNLSMLNYFFSIPTLRDGSIDAEKYQLKRATFAKMNISAYPETIEQYCGKFPTIFVSFKDIKHSSYDRIKGAIEGLIYNLYKTHSYLLKSEKLEENDKILIQSFIDKTADNDEIAESLLSLSGMLHAHFGKKVIILIDEYDTPMNDWYANALARNTTDDADHLLQNILSIFRGILGAALKDNVHLERSIITGILRIAKASLFSGLNNLTEDSILDHAYAKHFGFTEQEVKQLLHEMDMDRDDTSFNNITSWYNGYNIGGVTIYNPWSIMNYLNNKELRPYWVGTASTTLIENALILDKFQGEVQQLIEGNVVDMVADSKMVFTDIKSSPDALYNLLLFSGYLTVENSVANDDSSYECLVKIPNREIRGIFTSSIRKWLSTQFKIESREYNQFINMLLKGEMESFVETLREYLSVSSSFFSTGPKNAELFYNGFMLGLISSASMQYHVETEKESGGGRIDLVLIPKAHARFKNAIILEFKIGHRQEDLKEVATNALKQIKAKNYEAKIASYEGVEKTFKIGLAFCGKDAELVYEQ
eukprot:gene20445-26528_t